MAEGARLETACAGQNPAPRVRIPPPPPNIHDFLRSYKQLFWGGYNYGGVLQPQGFYIESVSQEEYFLNTRLRFSLIITDFMVAL